MDTAQKGILADVPRSGRYMSFSLADTSMIKECLSDIVGVVDGDLTVMGIGPSLAKALGKPIKGLENLTFEASVSGVDVPTTPYALWLWLRGDDRGEILHRSRMLEDILSLGFTLSDVVDSFQFKDSRDLTGYEDGTENPEGDEAMEAAIVTGEGRGMDGSSFVAVQQWLHDLDMFKSLPENEQDDVIGRHVNNNEEFDEAPESAHVKRAAQESFEPEAFMLRRSMPWAEGMDAGLIFVSFGKSFSAFTSVFNRMLGHEDGMQDALFSFTRPLSSAYFWCPPMKGSKLDLSLLEIY